MPWQDSFKSDSGAAPSTGWQSSFQQDKNPESKGIMDTAKSGLANIGSLWPESMTPTDIALIPAAISGEGLALKGAEALGGAATRALPGLAQTMGENAAARGAARLAGGAGAGAAGWGATGAASGAANAPEGKRIEGALKGGEEGAKMGAEFGGAGTLGNAALGKAGEVLAPKPVLAPTDVKALQKISQSSYDEAARLGGNYTPKFANDLLAKGEKLAAKEPAAEAIEGDTPLKALMKDAQAWKDKPMSLSAAEQVDKVLTNKITMQYKAGNKAYARDLENFQDEFRESMYNPSKEHAPEGAAGAAALKKATAQWSQMARMRDIGTIVQRAQDMTNPAEAIKTGFRNLYNNEKRISGFSPEEKAAIKKVAEGSPVNDFLKFMSSKLIPIIHAGTGGGIGSSALTYGGTKIAGSLAEAQKMREVEAVKRAIANRKIPGASADQALGAHTDPLSAAPKVDPEVRMAELEKTLDSGKLSPEQKAAVLKEMDTLADQAIKNKRL